MVVGPVCSFECYDIIYSIVQKFEVRKIFFIF